MSSGVSAGSLAAGAFAAYLVLVVPVSGAIGGREWRRRLAADGGLRAVVYRRAISRHWLLAGLAVGVGGLADMPASALGVRSPHVLVAGPAGFVAEAALLVVVAVAVFVLAGHRPVGAIAGLLPTTRDERALYAAVAVTAGIVEELLFRGFLMQYAIGVLGWSWQSAAVASAAVFGISHFYQGLATAGAAALIGLGFAESYTLTASLLVPVLLHVALDLRVLAWPTGSAAQKCKSPSRLSIRSPRWKTRGAEVSVPSPATNNSVGTVVEA
jgi:membrane protease YdiL (CAAX protease family)